MTGTFIDTIIICTLTGLTIIVSGAWLGDTNGAALTQAAFSHGYGAVAPILLTVSLTLFAFTTILAGTITVNAASYTLWVSKGLLLTACAMSPLSQEALSCSLKKSGRLRIL